MRRCRPLVLVEVEERHKANSVASVERFMRELGYECFFLKDGQLHSFDSFELARHQNMEDPGAFVRNFIFLIDGARARVEELLMAGAV